MRLDDLFTGFGPTPEERRAPKDYADRVDGTTVRAEPLPPRCSRWVIGDVTHGTFRTRSAAVHARRRAGVELPVILLHGIERVPGERRP